MVYKKSITLLTTAISIMAIISASTGIFSNDGAGTFEYKTIRGETIQIFGRGIYKHMSSDVAIQGIAQDYVTLMIAVPLLLISLYLSRKESLRARFLLAGTMLYFFLTYLFYTAMAMYNYLFMVYVSLLSCSLFALILSIISFDVQKVKARIRTEKTSIHTGWFLLLNSSLIAMLWLGTIVPPLLSGKLYPQGLNHYTTMIVQGFDLGIFLPLGFVSGLLAIQRKIWGALFTTVYSVFLAILMLALTSKVIFMAYTGVHVIPVIFIIPAMCFLSIVFSIYSLKNIQKNP